MESERSPGPVSLDELSKRYLDHQLIGRIDETRLVAWFEHDECFFLLRVSKRKAFSGTVVAVGGALWRFFGSG